MRSLHYLRVEVDAQIRSSAISIAREKFGEELQHVDLTYSNIRGGLESRAVKRIVLQGCDTTGRPRMLRFVAKHLEGATVREAKVYRRLLANSVHRVSPELLRIEERPQARAILFLEHVQPVSGWPWRDVSASRALLQQLAAFHEANRRSGGALPAWDYESVLCESAVTTLERLRQMRRDPDFAWVRRSLRSLDRLVCALPGWRSELLTFGSFGSGPIHGDLHPGNVIVRRRDGRREVVLIDWARARMGSALEDVSSWLQALGYWEPEARRRHDTLLTSYLTASGHEPRLRSDVREAYWIAAGCNALAGALRYHCWKAGSASSSRQRARAAHAARDWLRIVERASALSS